MRIVLLNLFQEEYPHYVSLSKMIPNKNILDRILVILHALIENKT